MRSCVQVALAIFLFSLVACSARSQPKDVCVPGSLVVVPSGWFLMGQNEGRQSHQPQRRVYLDAYAIDCTEVTNAAFGEFVVETGYRAIGWDSRLAEIQSDEPVAGVLWSDAEAYCHWMGKRLPTEAEWEKAARGTDGRRYPWGERWDSRNANTVDSGRGSVISVGSYPAGVSVYGVLDMSGNVAEWVADYFDPGYYSNAPNRNPQGPESVLDHGLRGGSWASPQEQAQTFFRDSSHSVRPNQRVGFRCVVSVGG